ncbi:hypothetical protein ACFOFO_23285 [Undibacterium arcticum]|uniref:Transmembrane protein n=1 Tax=Undibacterium arcticum TaxID=1762892 RepID=A0ABV7F7B8_9BURK
MNSNSRKQRVNHMSRGWFRLGILLTVIWFASAVAFLIYEYRSQNPFCQFDEPVASGPACEHVFWTWEPIKNSSTLFTTGQATEAKQVFTPQVGRVVFLLLGMPLLGWALAIGVAWVASGFRKST